MKNLHDFFPLSDEAGASTDGIENELMFSLCKSGEVLNLSNFEQIMQGHLEFLANGGTQGQWQSLLAGGLTLSIYTDCLVDTAKQANFSNKNLTNLDFSVKDVRCANFTNVYFPNGLFRKSKASNCMFIDSVLENVDFNGADLSKCDFSRSIMTNCNFTGANLSGCDFENCDLSGSDFTNAKLENSRFPGAKLNDVKY